MCMQVEGTGVWETPRKMFKVMTTGCIGPFSMTSIPAAGKWIKAIEEPTYKMSINYKPGFHVFETEEDAMQYSLGLENCYFASVEIVFVKGKYTKGTIKNMRDEDTTCFAVAEIQIPPKAEQE